MCRPSGDTNASNGRCWTSCQSRICAKRWNRSTFFSLRPSARSDRPCPASRTCDDLWRILQIDQHHIRAARLEFIDAFAAFAPHAAATAGRAARNWFRPATARVADARHNTSLVEPRHHVLGLFAVDAAIEHGDVSCREAFLELDSEPARIACVRRTRAGSGRRRRADRDDGQRLAARQAAAPCAAADDQDAVSSFGALASNLRRCRWVRADWAVQQSAGSRSDDSRRGGPHAAGAAVKMRAGATLCAGSVGSACAATTAAKNGRGDTGPRHAGEYF